MADPSPTNPLNTNDSTVAGFISPETTPEYDAVLDGILQAAIRGICNMPGWLVRPRLQPEPASQPDANVDWVAFGVSSIDPDWADYQDHVPTTGAFGDGYNVLQHDELIEVMLSFFGPNSMRNEMTLRVGIQIEQNRATLSDMGLEFVEQRRATRTPTLIKNIYVTRVDAVIVMRRRAEFVFPIRNIASAAFRTNTDQGLVTYTTVAVPNPAAPPGSPGTTTTHPPPDQGSFSPLDVF